MVATKKDQYFLPNVPKHALHKILSYLLLQQKANRNISITPQSVSQYNKNFQLLSRLRGTALCLLKTQFAKKPKNPI
jgi:hypothetical protein